MKKIIAIPLFFAAVHAFAVPLSVKEKSFDTIVIASVSVPNGSTVSWRSTLVPQYHARFQNITGTEVYIGTYSFSSNVGSFTVLLSTKGTEGSVLDLQVDGNPTWYFYGTGGNGGAGDVRIMQLK